MSVPVGDTDEDADPGQDLCAQHIDRSADARPMIAIPAGNAAAG